MDNASSDSFGGFLSIDASEVRISGRERSILALIVSDTLLVSVPLGVVTWTLPVVAPLGTVVVMAELVTLINVAAGLLSGTK